MRFPHVLDRCLWLVALVSLILGVGPAYYLFDGVELGLDIDFWLVGDPFIANVSPGLRYVLHFVPVIKPYAGVFYRHSFVSDFEDRDSVGTRLGVFYVTGGGSFLGIGVVYERYLACSGTRFVDCDGWYPELVLAISL